MRADHGDQAHRVPQCQLGGNRRANARAQAQRHIGPVQLRHGAQQFEPVAADTAHQVEVKARDHVRAALRGERQGALAAGLEIFAVQDEIGAQRTHGRVFLHAVAHRRDDLTAQAMQARGPGDALAMVATRGADDLLG